MSHVSNGRGGFLFIRGLGVLAYSARLAQSVEHETLNLRVVGSSPTLGADLLGSNPC